MDFFKAMLGGAAKAAGADKGYADEVFARSQEVYREAQKVIRKAAEEVYREGKGKGQTDTAFYTTLLIFLVVWQLIGWANQGVEPHREEKGDEHPVVRLWDLIRAAFEKPDIATSIKAMDDLTKKWGEPE